MVVNKFYIYELSIFLGWKRFSVIVVIEYWLVMKNKSSK